MNASPGAPTPQGSGSQPPPAVPPMPTVPPQVPPQPRPPSPLRSRYNVATLVILPAVCALAIWIVQGGWTWLWSEVKGPSGVTVHSVGVGGCVPKYLDASLDEAKKMARETSGMELVGDQGVAVYGGQKPTADMVLTLQAKTSQAVVVTGLKFKILSSKPLPKSGVMITPDGCGGPMIPRKFEIGLTKSPVSIDPVAPDSGELVDFPLKVADSDPEELELHLAPGDRDIRFTVAVEWVADGEGGSTVLDNGGRGYRVMGKPDLPTYAQKDLY